MNKSFKSICLSAILFPVLGCACCRAEAAPFPDGGDTVNIPVFMYHGFTRDPEVAANNSYYVTEQAFDRQLSELLENGYTPIFASEIGKAMPDKPIVITMDDGYLDNYEIAFPVLKKHGVKATVFLIAGKQDWGCEGFLSWDNAREMLESGLVDFQSHSYDLHHDGLGLKTPSGKRGEEHRLALTEDANKLDAAFMKELGYTPSVICYPYGAYDNNVLAAYKDRYSIGFTTEKKTADTGMDMMLLPRWKGEESTKITGSYG